MEKILLFFNTTAKKKKPKKQKKQIIVLRVVPEVQTFNAEFLTVPTLMGENQDISELNRRLNA